jgi:hypothetical protein
VYYALNHRVWRVGVHHVEDRMNYLIALDSQERRSKDLLQKGGASRHWTLERCRSANG